jgi:hypothetical protein
MSGLKWPLPGLTGTRQVAGKHIFLAHFHVEHVNSDVRKVYGQAKVVKWNNV